MKYLLIIAVLACSKFSHSQEVSMDSFVGIWAKEDELEKRLYFIQIRVSSDGNYLEVHASHYNDDTILPSSSAFSDGTVFLWLDEEMESPGALPHLFTLESDGRLLDTFGETKSYYKR